LAEEGEIPRRAVFACEVARVSREDEVRVRGLDGEVLERRTDLLRARDRVALLLVEPEALGRRFAQPSEVRPLCCLWDLLDALEDGRAARDDAVEVIEVACQPGLPGERV